MNDRTEAAIVRMIRDGGKPRVGLDVDNTSADLSKLMLPGLNKMLQKEYTLTDLNSSWQWMERTLHLDPSVYWLLYNDAWSHPERMGRLIEPEELGALSRRYHVDFVTAKESHTTMPYVFQWITRNFPEHRGAVIEVDIGESKTAFGHRLLVDDAPHLAEQVEREEGKLLYLIRGNGSSAYGYNAHINPSGKVRPVVNTHEAVRALLMLARKADSSERVMVTRTRG